MRFHALFRFLRSALRLHSFSPFQLNLISRRQLRELQIIQRRQRLHHRPFPLLVRVEVPLLLNLRVIAKRQSGFGNAWRRSQAFARFRSLSFLIAGRRRKRTFLRKGGECVRRREFSKDRGFERVG